jgi:secondary thiamine-phosphate synthase enzyme
MPRETFVLESQKNKEVLDITDIVNQKLQNLEAKDGICHLFALHTTVALSVADLDPGTDLDMLDAFEELIPKLQYRHPHNPEHVPDHILSAIIKSELTLPIQNGKLILGSWQKVVFFEFDGPRKREIVLTVLS